MDTDHSDIIPVYCDHIKLTSYKRRAENNKTKSIIVNLLRFPQEDYNDMEDFTRFPSPRIINGENVYNDEMFPPLERKSIPHDAKMEFLEKGNYNWKKEFPKYDKLTTEEHRAWMKKEDDVSYKEFWYNQRTEFKVKFFLADGKLKSATYELTSETPTPFLWFLPYGQVDEKYPDKRMELMEQTLSRFNVKGEYDWMRCNIKRQQKELEKN